METSTIAAISTPQGSGGIGIIRVSGPQAVTIGDSLFRSYSGKKISSLAGYTGMLGEVWGKEEVLDQAIVYRYQSPKSYTGEDVIELSSHGGSWVMSQILRRCLELGAVPAEPGEFTKRAFLNGKMDLVQAEGVMDLISAQGNASLQAANQLREGALSQKIQNIIDLILTQSGHLAAWADYPEEEMEMVKEEELEGALHGIRQKIAELLQTYDYGKIVREGITTAIVGKPNVGKSTLMNLLTGYELSIVSDIPGTTRDVVREYIRLGNFTLHLSDTAGIRDTEDTIEKVGVERSKKQMEGAQLVLALFDYSQQLSVEDEELIDLLKDKTAIALVNKGDLEGKLDLHYLKEKFPAVLVISAKNGSGLEKLEGMIETILDLNRFNQGDTVVITNERQRQSLLRCDSAIAEGIEALQMGMTLDAVGVCMDEGLDELLSLNGQKVQEAVVHEIFSHFCVGK